MLLFCLTRIGPLRDNLELITGLLMLAIAAALLGWSVPRLTEVFLSEEQLLPTTHISAGSDCEFRQKTRIEFNVDARSPATFTLAFRDIASPTPSHPCEYIYVQFPGRLNHAYADALPGPMPAVEYQEDIYQRSPGKQPLVGKAFLDASRGTEARFTVAVRDLPERLRTGDIYINGELGALLHNTSFSGKVLHYWVRLPGSHIRDGCQTESECEDDYLMDNPDVAAIDLIFSWNLGIRSVLLANSVEALTRQGQVKITTASLAGSVFVEDKENARSRDVILLYSGALFATGIAIGTDGIIELIRFAVRRSGHRLADRGEDARRTSRRDHLQGRDADAGHNGE
jgi:hypothetical protein